MQGHDCANVNLETGQPWAQAAAAPGDAPAANRGPNQQPAPDRDEVKNYLDGRYVSASEAAWRIFSFRVHKEAPQVMRLALHLENQEVVYWTAERTLSQERPMTTLNAWFAYNRAHQDARNILYVDFPSKYTFDAKMKVWKPRKHGRVVGRIHSVSRAQKDVYALRLLLMHVLGATSFRDLRTVDDVVYDTFPAAAQALGLLHNDEEHDKCLEEASTYQMPGGLRRLFATLLVFSTVGDPWGLWVKHKAAFCWDIRHQRLGGDDGPFIDQDEHKGLRALDALLRVHGMDLSKFHGLSDHLPPPEHEDVQDDVAAMLREHVPRNMHDVQDRVDARKEMYNAEQRHIYDN